MPTIKTKRVITFTEEEKELINKIMTLVDGIGINFCEGVSCGSCPFQSLCKYDYNADSIERQMNKMLNH